MKGLIHEPVVGGGPSIRTGKVYKDKEAHAQTTCHTFIYPVTVASSPAQLSTFPIPDVLSTSSEIRTYSTLTANPSGP